MTRDAGWIKSSRSGAANENCVELSRGSGRVRDSKNPDGPMLVVDLNRFIAAVKADRF
jgi:hypothetical protein